MIERKSLVCATLLQAACPHQASFVVKTVLAALPDYPKTPAHIKAPVLPMVADNDGVEKNHASKHIFELKESTWSRSSAVLPGKTWANKPSGSLKSAVKYARCAAVAAAGVYSR